MRERRRTFEERLSARLDEEVDKVVGAFFEALEAEYPVIGKEGEVVAYLPAHQTRLRAARDVIHEAYGKPTQRVEITGEDGEPVAHEHRLKLTLGDVADFANTLAGNRPS